MTDSRYTPNQTGGYDRHDLPRPPAPDPPPPKPHPPLPPPPPPPPEPPGCPPCPPRPPRPPRPPAPPRRRGSLQGLQSGDLLMLAILYLLLSEEEDGMLPLIAIGLYLIL